ncbi:MAG: hypothetical protein HZB51_19575 [Chloroflexi bacterium]|nr:hypothetical protein [Chloroflexota bacterium]
MASKQTKSKEKSMPTLAAEIQSALEKVLGKGNVVDWSLELTTTNSKFAALGRTNQRYLSSDKFRFVYGEGDKELSVTALEDEMTDDFESIPF